MRRRVRRRRQYVPMYVDREFYENVLKPLLAMFATCDDVFTEDDALSDKRKIKIGFGRIYEEWKRCRTKLDPGFVHSPDERPQKWLASQVKAERSARRSRRATD